MLLSGLFDPWSETHSCLGLDLHKEHALPQRELLGAGRFCLVRPRDPWSHVLFAIAAAARLVDDARMQTHVQAQKQVLEPSAANTPVRADAPPSMRAPESRFARDFSGIPVIQRKCAGCADEEEEQRAP